MASWSMVSIFNCQTYIYQWKMSTVLFTRLFWLCIHKRNFENSYSTYLLHCLNWKKGTANLFCQVILILFTSILPVFFPIIVRIQMYTLNNDKGVLMFHLLIYTVFMYTSLQMSLNDQDNMLTITKEIRSKLYTCRSRPLFLLMLYSKDHLRGELEDFAANKNLHLFK